MRPFIILAAILYVTGCSSLEENRRTELMDVIERQVRLPAGAEGMNQYARVYKFASPDRIAAFYFVPAGEHDEWFCEGAKKAGRTNGQIALVCPPPDGMKAGERRWFDDDVYLPDVSDGGCSYIDVEYDLRKRTVVYASCHGPG